MGNGIFSDEIEGLDFPLITKRPASSYWPSGIERTLVEKGAHNSTVTLRVFDAGRQIADARAVSDTTRFAFIAEVFVGSAYRGRSIAKKIVRRLTVHPKLKDAAHGYLITRDAPTLYRSPGFEPYARPDRTFTAWNRPI